jgi:4'-phosphopantetheinyl transferase
MTENDSWFPATAGVQLSTKDVHVWRASLDVDADVRERLSSILSAAERERGARFAFTRERNRFVVARAILRQLLAGYLSELPQNLLLETLAHGKPTISAAASIPTLRFNLSHSHGLALFAFCFEHEVGIDIEKIRPEVAFEGIESRYFSPMEREELETLPMDVRPEGFFLCWTRKEAYVKAKGAGLQIPLESFDVSLTPGKPAVLQSSDKDRWSLHSLYPETGYVGALVVEGRGHRLRLWEWSESNRLSSL